MAGLFREKNDEIQVASAPFGDAKARKDGVFSFRRFTVLMDISWW